ncbi:uncharacterized protein LOC121246970 [Juglans microcarpa x Juglans regia]|uniref:uncharacterized protein LOC121246970 n=1 Tax=Juglans microcarpa x Juglans regia TaxID=2249226 RepID=UPI001B7E486C|nr:uncharacterized protein LOC121246970 [Juglans microcarpa x Juglans regia]
MFVEARFFIRMSSSASSWTSANNPMCTCGKPAKLRTSNTLRNPGRSFFRCPNYNTERLLYCNYFKWANRSEEREKDLMKIELELLRNEEELRRRDEEIVKYKLGIHNDQLDIKRQQAEIRRERTLLKISWIIFILISLYCICKQ